MQNVSLDQGSEIIAQKYVTIVPTYLHYEGTHHPEAYLSPTRFNSLTFHPSREREFPEGLKFRVKSVMHRSHYEAGNSYLIKVDMLDSPYLNVTLYVPYNQDAFARSDCFFIPIDGKLKPNTIFIRQSDS